MGMQEGLTRGTICAKVQGYRGSWLSRIEWPCHFLEQKEVGLSKLTHIICQIDWQVYIVENSTLQSAQRHPSVYGIVIDFVTINSFQLSIQFCSQCTTCVKPFPIAAQPAAWLIVIVVWWLVIFILMSFVCMIYEIYIVVNYLMCHNVCIIIVQNVDMQCNTLCSYNVL